MMNRDESIRPPYPPARAIMLPIASMLLSLPIILVGLFLLATGVYRIVTGSSLYSGPAATVQVPVPVCLALILGPLLGAVLCTMQRTRAEQDYGSALLLGYRPKRLNTLVLWCSALGILMLPLMALVGTLANGINPR